LPRTGWLLLCQLDLKELRPVLARHEEPVLYVVVGNTVEHIHGLQPILRAQEPSEVEPAHDLPGFRRDHRYAIRRPDVRVDRALDILQFVELRNGGAPISDLELVDRLEAPGIQEIERRGPIAHDQVLSVVSNPPAFGRVAELAAKREALLIVDESEVRLVRKLDQRIVPEGDAFPEVLGRQLIFLQNAPRRQLNLPQARGAVQARALVEHAVSKDQPLRVGRRIVRVNVHDFGAVHGRVVEPARRRRR